MKIYTDGKCLPLYFLTSFCIHSSHFEPFFLYNIKPVLNGHSKIDKTKILLPNGSLMVNTFDLHYAIISIEYQYFVFLRVAVLYRFYCISEINK